MLNNTKPKKFVSFKNVQVGSFEKTASSCSPTTCRRRDMFHHKIKQKQNKHNAKQERTAPGAKVSCRKFAYATPYARIPGQKMWAR